MLFGLESGRTRDRLTGAAAFAIAVVLTAGSAIGAADVSDRLERALTAAREGRVAEGIALLELELSTDLDDLSRISTLGTLGDLHLHLGDTDGALARYQDIIDLDPSFGRAYFMKGVALQRNVDRLEEAIESFRASMEHGYETSEVRSNLGLCYKTAVDMGTVDGTVAEQYLQRAESSLLGALLLDPQNFSARGNLADLHYNAGRHDKAIAGYEQLRAQMGDSAFILVRLGDAYLASDNVARALEVFESAESVYVPTDPGIAPELYFANIDTGTLLYLGLAEAQRRFGHVDQTVSSLERLLVISECPDCTHESKQTSFARKKARELLSELEDRSK